MKILNVALRSALFIAFAFMASSLSCDLFDKVDDVTFDVVIEHTFVIDENEETDGKAYSKTDEIDPTQNDEFNKYKDKIKELTIDEITYTVANYEGDPGINFTGGHGTFTASANSTTAIGSAGITIQNISGSVGKESQLSYAIADLDKIAAQLKDVKSIFFNVSGNFSKTPVAFSVPVKIKCTIKAEAL